MMNYDLLIIGAGPGGITFSGYRGESGRLSDGDRVWI